MQDNTAKWVVRKLGSVPAAENYVVSRDFATEFNLVDGNVVYTSEANGGTEIILAPKSEITVADFEESTGILTLSGIIANIEDTPIANRIKAFKLGNRTLEFGFTVDDIFAQGVGKNSVYRGKNLGTYEPSTIAKFLSDHKVSQGIFEDLYLGDYFEIRNSNYNKTYVIVAFNPHFGLGDGAGCTTNHIGVMPIDGMGLLPIDNQEAARPIINTTLTTSTLPDIEEKLTADFNNHILSRRCYLVSSVSSGKSQTCGWVSKKLSIPSEAQIFGCSQANSSYLDNGEANTKLPIFNFVTPGQCLGRIDFWLRGVASINSYSYVTSSGVIDTNRPNVAHNIMPLICLY